MLAAGFVNDAIIPGSYALADLMAVNPALYPRRYAWCTDLFGGPGDWCISDGVSWKPVRPFSMRSASIVSDMNLTPMVDAPTQLISGTIGTGVSRAVTLSTTYAYKGAVFRTCRKAGGLGTLLVNGLGISLNSWSDHEFDGNSWIQTASGGLL